MGFALDTTAYAKAAMHALAHPAQAVNGVFLGKVINGDVVAMDAVPLFHGLSLAPMVEVALMQLHVGSGPHYHLRSPTASPQAPGAHRARAAGVFNAQQVEEHCQQQGLAIVGYYHANEYMDDMELPVSAKKIASKIASHCPQAAALLVDSTLLKGCGTEAAPVLFKLLTRSGGKWHFQASEQGLLTVKAGGTAVLAQYVGEERYTKLRDFSDHLLDVTADWLNPELTQ